MIWRMYKVTYELRSPLHIGYHKMGNVQRTRYYVPARNVWGAVTEALTRCGFSTDSAPKGDYGKIGEWIKDHCAFGYWFIEENGEPLYPCYKDGELKYDPYTSAEFERRYLDTHVTTALDAATTSAAEGSLHEVEFIAPYHPAKPDKKEVLPTRIGGWVFLDETASPLLGEETKWRNWLGDLQIGGERRYGFGRLQFLEMAQDDHSPVELNCVRPRLRVEGNTPLRAHTVISPHIQVRGAIEPLVGRTTSQSHAFGSNLTRGIICWTPGSLPAEEVWVQLEREGYWKFEKPKGATYE